jgi:hypothetical protein
MCAAQLLSMGFGGEGKIGRMTEDSFLSSEEFAAHSAVGNAGLWASLEASFRRSRRQGNSQLDCLVCAVAGAFLFANGLFFLIFRSMRNARKALIYWLAAGEDEALVRFLGHGTNSPCVSKVTRVGAGYRANRLRSIASAMA